MLILIVFVFVYPSFGFRACRLRTVFPFRSLRLSILLRVLNVHNKSFELTFGGVFLCDKVPSLAFLSNITSTVPPRNALEDPNFRAPDLFRLLKARRLEYERNILGTWVGEDMVECSETEIAPTK